MEVPKYSWGVPRTPTLDGPIEITEKSIRLRWKAPIINTGKNHWPVDGYKLDVTPKPVGWEDNQIEIDSDQTTYVVKEIDPKKEYEFELRAFNALGDGDTAFLAAEPTATPTSTPSPTETPTPTRTPGPTATPTPIPIPVPVTPTPTPTPYRNKRDSDPDPPEEFDWEQGRHGIVVYWDDPQWDGGSSILAYAVDWHPESPPFPLFLPQVKNRHGYTV